MSIVKTNNGRWRVRYYEPGVKNPRSRTFDSKRQALDFEADLRTAKRRTNTDVRGASRQTLGDFGAEYRAKYAEVELAPSTLAVQRSIWNHHILPRLGHVELATLANEPELIQQFKADLKADGVRDGAVAKALAVLGAVLNKAVQWHRIPSNPVQTVKKPPQKRKRVVEPISPEGVERLRAQTMDAEGGDGLVPGTDSVLICLMAYAGLRPGEALALTWGDIGERTISVTKAISLGEVGDTKTKRDRVVPLLAPLRDDLEALRELRRRPVEAPDGKGPLAELHAQFAHVVNSFGGELPDDDALIFPRDGHPWRDHDWRNWRKRVWQPACAAVGLATLTTKPRRYVGPRPYDLRHSCASLQLAAGTSPLEVADMLGHGPQILFSTYAHVISELRGQPTQPAEDRIQAARAATGAQGRDAWERRRGPVSARHA